MLKTVSIRVLRQDWPATEAQLKREGELIVTRDGHPVARLLPCGASTSSARARFSSAQNAKWREKTFGSRLITLVDDALARDRSDES